MTDWRPDVLGEGFECIDLDLGEDEEGPLVATLVRALPAARSLWQRLLRRERMLERVDVLYVHGWADYFFQRHLARFFTDRGARFFALDLRKYGRSLREGQTPCYIEDLQSYDEEIDLALGILRQNAPEVPRELLLLGHSTGGLVLSLWADRHPGEADAIVLNSPWLELQVPGAVRRLLAPMVNMRARLNPFELALPQLDLDFYARAQRAVCKPEDLEGVNPVWRPEHPMGVMSGWLRAIIGGHTKVSSGLDIDAPVCVLLSKRSQFGVSWNAGMERADTVLEVEEIAKAALRLGPSVTVERIDGALHDVFLSEESARAEAYARMDRWLRGWQAAPRADR